MKRPELLSRERKSTDSRFNTHGVQMACTILNTADYCYNTATEVCGSVDYLPNCYSLISEVRGETERKDRRNVQRENHVAARARPFYRVGLYIRVVRTLNDTYRVISLSITQVLRDLETTVEPFLLTMTRTTWATLESVSGQQAHVIEMVVAIESFVEVTKSQLEQKKYLRNFYDKAAAFVFPTSVVRFSEYDYRILITKFTNAMVKSRPLKEIGAEQACCSSYAPSYSG